MLKLAVAMALVALVGCENPEAGISEAETSAAAQPPQTESASAPAQVPAPAPATPIVGCWLKNTPGVAVTISINADQTCSELVVAAPAISAGRAVLASCTWTLVDSSSITFTYPDAPQLCTYIIVGDALTMLCPDFHEPQTYQRTVCN